MLRYVEGGVLADEGTCNETDLCSSAVHVANSRHESSVRQSGVQVFLDRLIESIWDVRG